MAHKKSNIKCSFDSKDSIRYSHRNDCASSIRRKLKKCYAVPVSTTIIVGISRCYKIAAELIMDSHQNQKQFNICTRLWALIVVKSSVCSCNLLLVHRVCQPADSSLIIHRWQLYAKLLISTKIPTIICHPSWHVWITWNCPNIPIVRRCVANWERLALKVAWASICLKCNQIEAQSRLPLFRLWLPNVN